MRVTRFTLISNKLASMVKVSIIAFLFFTLSAAAQHRIGIYELNGKYGYSQDDEWTAQKKFIVEPIYDTILHVGGLGEFTVLQVYKEGQKKFLTIKILDDHEVIHALDTLEISHVYTSYHRDDDLQLIATNSLGKAYKINSYLIGENLDQLEFSELSDRVSICKHANGQYFLSKNKKKLAGDYDLVVADDGFFAAYSNEGCHLYSENGKMLFQEAIDSFQREPGHRNTIHLYKGNKRAYIKLDEKDHLDLLDINTPNRMWVSGKYGSDFEFIAPSYLSVGIPGKMGLVNAEGKEVWSRQHKSIIVVHQDGAEYILKQTKKEWEIYNSDLHLIKSLNFDAFIGSDNKMAFVKLNKQVVGLDLSIGEMTSSDYTENYKDFRLILSANNKLGAINSNGELVIPCNFKHAVEREDEIISMLTDTGYIAINSNGKLISNHSYDKLWAFEKPEGAYVYKKGKRWGIFTLDGRINLPPTKMHAGDRQFNIDVEAHTHMPEQVIFEEGGKLGIMNLKGGIIHEAIYDNIINSHYTPYPMYLGMLNDKWFVFKTDMSELRQVHASYFIQFSKKFGVMFADEKKLICIDANTLKDIEYNGSLKYGGIEVVKADWLLHGERLEGAVNHKGEIIIAIDYQSVSLNVYSTQNPNVIVTNEERNKALYTITGEKILDFDYYSLHRVCVGFDHVLFTRKLNHAGEIMLWNAQLNTLKTLLTGVERVTCVKHKKLDHIAEIQMSDGSKKKMYADLRIED